MNRIKFNVLDLFAGCGGLSIGLNNAGFQTRWACEWDKDAADTYGDAHKKTSMFNGDANEFLIRCAEQESGTPQPGEVDLIAGGPPCQGFSGYNRYRSPTDPRNSLVETYLSFVELLRPRYVLMENVPGILQMEHGKTIELLLAALKNLDYEPQLGILQAGHYGLPQNRWRVFIIAARKGENIPVFPLPTHAFPKTTLFGATNYRAHVIKTNNNSSTLFENLLPNTTVKDAIDDLPPVENGSGIEEMNYLNEPNCNFQRILRSDNDILTDHIVMNQGKIMMSRIVLIPRKQGSGWLDLPEELKPRNLAKHGDKRYDNRFGRLWWSGIFNTIVTKPEPYWGRFIHPEQDRVLSVRECARAQGFPDSVTFKGKIKSRYRQVGNAVPPPLAQAIGNQLYKALSSD